MFSLYPTTRQCITHKRYVSMAKWLLALVPRSKSDNRRRDLHLVLLLSNDARIPKTHKTNFKNLINKSMSFCFTSLCLSLIRHLHHHRNANETILPVTTLQVQAATLIEVRRSESITRRRKAAVVSINLRSIKSRNLTRSTRNNYNNTNIFTKFIYRIASSGMLWKLTICCRNLVLIVQDNRSKTGSCRDGPN